LDGGIFGYEKVPIYRANVNDPVPLWLDF